MMYVNLKFKFNWLKKFNLKGFKKPVKLNKKFLVLVNKKSFSTVIQN